MKQRYDSYKPSGIDWIGEIPSHWKLPRVKQFVKINNGSDPKTEGDIPVYGSGSGSFKTCGEYKIGPTVLLGRKGATLHIPHWIEGKYWNVDTAFDTKIIKGLNLRLFFYLSTLFDYNRYKSETTLPSMTQTDYGNMYIPLPTLEEQEAIAAWLGEKCGEIDSAIAKVDREIELIDELKQSEISRVVTRGLNPNAPLRPSGIDWIGDVPEHWTIENGKYLLIILPGFPADSNLFVAEEEGFPLIRIRDIDSSNTEIRYTGIVPETHIIHKGDMLVGMDGDFNVAKWKGPDGLLNQRVCKITGSPNYHSQYAYYVLPKLLKRINDVTYATTVKHLSTYDIANSKLPVPPLSEQKEIANYLDKKCAEIDGLKEKLVKKCETLKELRQAIISEVVTGKKKVI